MNRTLSLKREELAALSADDLLTVAGAALPTSPLGYCLNSQVVCYTEAAGPSRCLCPTEV
ncbi:MAG TPA: hypothetical protein VGX28_01515 [Frankiaceae bacterium]|nr:hypothetical protein [Frankiaceae bacterium]